MFVHICVCVCIESDRERTATIWLRKKIKEYPRKKYKIPVADKIEWQQSWFTNTGSYYDYESNKSIAVSSIVSKFNTVFDLASNEYNKKYYSGGQEYGCVVSFTIKNGKVVYINISIPVG